MECYKAHIKFHENLFIIGFLYACGDEAMTGDDITGCDDVTMLHCNTA
jgi:hypothetical protein